MGGHRGQGGGTGGTRRAALERAQPPAEPRQRPRVTVPTLSLSPRGGTSGTGTARPGWSGLPAGNDAPKPPPGNAERDPPAPPRPHGGVGLLREGGHGEILHREKAEGTKVTWKSPAVATPARAPGRARGLMVPRGTEVSPRRTVVTPKSRGCAVVWPPGERIWWPHGVRRCFPAPQAGVCPVCGPWGWQRGLPASP